jgi:hypothetical protein
MRSFGITLPGKGRPVSGSRISRPPEKFPARSFNVGITADCAVAL